MYALFNKILQIARNGGGEILLPELLGILNFPDDVEKKINDARGSVKIKAIHGELKATNQGKKLEVDIPGTGGIVGIIVAEYFSCRFKGGSVTEPIIEVFDIKGLKLNPPGPEIIVDNPDVRKLVLKLPDHIELIT